MTANEAPRRPEDDETLRLLRNLSRASSHIARSAPDGEGVSYRLHREAGAAAVITGVSAACVDAALSGGLLRGCGSRIVLAAAGVAWLKRRLSQGDPFRDQHEELVLRVGSDGRAADASGNEIDPESPLGWLRRRKDKSGRPLIDDAQLAAGERLRRDFWLAQLGPRVTASWSGLASSRRTRRSAGGGGVELRDTVIAARRRVEHAIAAVGPELSGVLMDVCCHLKGIEAIEDAEGWPQRSGKLVLQLALTRLARCYGLIGSQSGAGPVGQTYHWGAEDYRPSL